MELVSVVIPSFRQPQFLQRAISSVLEQDHEALEVVVVDDAGDDRSLGLARAMRAQDARVRVVERRVNGGLGRARNTGLMASRGDWVTFLDSDDYLLPGALSSRMAVLAQSTADGVVGAYGDWVHVGELTDHPESVRAPRADLGVLDRSSYKGDNLFICSSPIVRRDRLVDVGGFGEGLPMLEDFVAWVRMLEAGGVFLPTPHVVCVYRQRPMSMLRGRGLVLPSSVRAINDWWLGRGGTLGDGGRLRDWCANGSPYRHQRIDWTTSGAGSSVPASPVRPAAGQPVRTQAYAQIRAQLERTARDLDDALSDTAEIDPAGSPSARPGGPMPTPDLVLVPTDAEGALECAALAPRAEALGLGVEIRVLRADDLGLLPASLGGERVGLFGDPDPGALHVVFASRAELLAPVARAVGKERVVHRLTGVDSFRVFARGYTRRYRQGAGLLLRTRLEMAEIAESGCDHLPSGVRYAAPAAAAADLPLAVFVPRAAAQAPAVEAWVATVTGQLSAAGIDVTLLGAPEVAARLPAFRFAELQPHGPLRGVVLPVCDEVALLESRGVPCVLFDPGYSAEEFSPPWRASHPVAQTLEDVRALLSPVAAVPADEWSAGLARWDDPTLTADAWAELFVGLMETRGHLKRT